MEKKTYYSIGQASKICDVSARMLRYYEQIGLIMPDKISEETGYRYYTIATMRDVQCIRYLVDEGFSLEEIKQSLFADDIEKLQNAFLRRIEETEAEIQHQQQRLESLKDWCVLLMEGKEVLRHKAFAPCIKYIPRQLCFYYERQCDAGEENSDLYIETEYFTKSKNDGHSMIDVGGAFNLYYDSWRERAENTYTRHTLLQTMYMQSASMENTMTFGGFNAVTVYHTGSMEGIGASYEKLVNWAEKHNFVLRGDCLERHVLDLCSTKNSDLFVTEILLPLKEEPLERELMDKWKSNFNAVLKF